MIDADMKKYIEIGELIAIYGELLTKNQLELLNYYYNDNYSLQEIAENTNMSRQSVSYIIKKGEKKLLYYEEKLGIMKKSRINEEQVQTILNELSKIKNDSSEKEITKIINQVQKELRVIA